MTTLPDHCKRGHPYTPENTLIKHKRGSTYRQCRECSRILLWGDRYKEKANGFLGPTKGPDRVRCKRGHLATKENTYTILRNGRIDRECRGCDADRKREFDINKIKDRMHGLVQFLKDGGTIAQAEDHKILTQYDWDRFRAQQPKVADKLKKLSFKNGYANKRSVREQMLKAPAIIKRWTDAEIVEAATAAIPHSIPFDDRQEIISQMVLACLEGRIAPNQMARRWVEFRKENTKFYNPRFNALAHYRQRHMPVLSLESTLLFASEGDGVTLGTTLSNGFWDQSMNPEELLIMKEDAAG